MLGRRSAGSGAACTHRGAIDGVKPAGRFFPGLVVCVVCGDPIGNKSCLRGGYVDLSITDHVTHQPLQPQPVPAQRRGPAGVLQIVWSRCALRWNLRLLIKKTQPLVTYFSGKKSLRLNAICGAKTNGIISEMGQNRKSSMRAYIFRLTLRLCENSDVELARREFVSITLNKKRTALAVVVEGGKGRKQFCAFSARARFHTAWVNLRNTRNEQIISGLPR